MTQYIEVKSLMRDIFIEDDPINIYFPDVNNIDEYDPEIDKILPVLKNMKSEDELHELIWNVFKEMFTKETAGPKEHYATISKKVWDIKQKYVDSF